MEVKDTCDCEFSYLVIGPDAEYLGEGLLHSSNYDTLGKTVEFAEFTRYKGKETNLQHCSYTMSVYPSQQFEAAFDSNDPVVYAVVLVSVFVFKALVFFVYNCMVERRNTKVMMMAERTTAIVSSLFPKQVQQRILEDAEEQAKEKQQKTWAFGLAPKSRMKDFLSGGNEFSEHKSQGVTKSKPIADLFPSATIMFADLVGFTAWSSTREPSQVFTLLETIYQAFDEIAANCRIFKVEAIGDCCEYKSAKCSQKIPEMKLTRILLVDLAVAGLLEPRKDHAVAMAFFSCDILHKLNNLLRQLEVTLGPDTVDLVMRIGLHSGPVTAGVSGESELVFSCLVVRSNNYCVNSTH